MEHRPARGRRALALAFVAAVALLAVAPYASAASPSLPDAGRTGSLTIYKTTAGDDPTGLPADGSALPPGSLPASLMVTAWPRRVR